MKDFPKRLHYLDILRGVAALCIVLRHWMHFFYNGTDPSSLDHQRLPLYRILSPIYEEGSRAVQLFFCLSGFLFFWLYARRINERKVTLGEFALLRFSRLYPLHLLTLLLVLVGQLLMKAKFGTFFVYQFNDVYHFVLQLLFASQWGFQRDYSFNGPIWSVSIEVLLYVIFSLTCLLGLIRWWHLLMLVMLSWVLSHVNSPFVTPISSAAVSFFCGCLSFKVASYAYTRQIFKRHLWVLFLICVAMWILIPVATHGRLFARLCESCLFPLTIIFLVLLESYKGSAGKRFGFIGEASYSFYLLHFPLQMAFYGVFRSYNMNKEIFYSPLTLFCFFGILVPLSVCMYRYFERPCQDKIRELLIKPHARTAI